MEKVHSAAHWRWKVGDLVDVRLAKSWVLIVGGLALAQLRASAGTDGPRRWAPALGNALAGAGVPLVAVALHEGGHAAVARALGWRRPVVVLDPFAATTRVDEHPQHPAQEAAFALAGVAANLLLAGVAGIGARRLGGSTLGRILGLGASFNLSLAVVNVIPAPPLDGGLALRAGLWHRSNDRPLATRQSEVVGGWVGLAMVLAGFVGWRRRGLDGTWGHWTGMLGVAGAFALLARLAGPHRGR